MRQYLQPILKNALKTCEFPSETPIPFEIPRNPEHGDLCTTVALSLAKITKENPRAIGQKIMAALKYDDSVITQVEIAGAGFINFKFADNFYTKRLAEIIEKGNNYGRSHTNEGKKVNVEYVSANPTGMLHVGHGRNAAIGDTVANLLDWVGYEVTREYYFNNAGNQMNMLAESIYASYRRQLDEPDFPFPENGYHGEYVHVIAKELIEKFGDSMKQHTAENLKFFMKEGEKWCFDSISKTLVRMNIRQDIQFNEDSLYTDNKIKPIVEELREKGFVYENEGATWLALKKVGMENDRVIIRSNGEPTYRLPDIAYHVDKIRRGFDILVDIFGADHIATIPDVMAAVEMLGYDKSKIKVLIYQFVTLWENGEQVKMSKRSGKSYTLDELIEEVGADVVRFFFIMRSANTPLEFDLNLAREQSEKNPVFYLQYAHARISSIIRTGEERGIKAEIGANLNLLVHSTEIDLIKELLRFPEVVQKAAESMEPQVLTEYLRIAASGFHKFYHECRILGEAVEIMQARLQLALAAKTVMKNGLTILGISAPEKM